LLFDPETALLVERGSDQPVVTPQLLSYAGFRQAFGRHPVWVPEYGDDVVQTARRSEATEPKAAAVLIPVVPRSGQLHIVLTQRTVHLHDHAGQISFPGGRHEPEDETPQRTALREAEEEIGLAAHQLDVLGLLPDYLTATGYRVTPVVALVDPDVVWVPDPNEVAEVFETPLSFLMNPMHHEKRQVRWSETRQGQWVENVRHFYAMPWQDGSRNYFIWGATAAMLRNLYLFLRAQA
jgi:8-oxo-dGTP pyrophosphatase MutT (NUDIX family)